MDKMPKWADVILIPLISVLLGADRLGARGSRIGENPVEAMQIMVRGAFGSPMAGATRSITRRTSSSPGWPSPWPSMRGCSTSAARGRRRLAGSAWRSCSWASAGRTGPSRFWPRSWGGAVRRGLGAIPAYLQAKRGSHIVITTIMFNFIASALLVYLLVNVFRVEGSMAPESARFAEAVHLPSAARFRGFLGFRGSTPLNFAFFIALLACVGSGS
jgi:ABC-type uncharacterized transport system permease subunit